ncbi:MAG: hypothetical protein PWR25_1219 [Euryarchaeota archaeon]|nr:hypothetical protein [Euryarchaeota archaeon]
MKQKTVEKMRGSLEALCACIPSPAAAVFPGTGVLAATEAYRRWFGNPDDEVSRALDRSEGVREANRTCRPAAGTVTLPHLDGDLTLVARCIPLPDRAGSAAGILVVFDDEDSRRGEKDPDAACRESARELDEHLRLLASGSRVPIAPINPGDPLASTKRSYNAALEAVEGMLAVSGLFGRRLDR